MERNKSIEQIQELVHYLLMGVKGSTSYELPDKYQKHMSAPLFQAMGDLMTKGRYFYMGGSVLDYDYCFAGIRGSFYNKAIEHIYPSLVDKDLYIVFTQNNKPSALAYDISDNSFSIIEIARKTTKSEVILSIKPNRALDAIVTAPILSKYLFTRARDIRDQEIIHNKPLR